MDQCCKIGSSQDHQGNSTFFKFLLVFKVQLEIEPAAGATFIDFEPGLSTLAVEDVLAWQFFNDFI